MLLIVVFMKKKMYLPQKEVLFIDLIMLFACIFAAYIIGGNAERGSRRSTYSFPDKGTLGDDK